MRRRRLFILGVVLTSLVLVGAGGWLLSKTRWAQGELQRGLAHLLSRELGLPVRLSDFTVSLRPNRFEIRRLEVLDPESQTPLLQIDRIQIALEWTSLFRRVIKVNAVTLSNPVLTVNDSPRFRETVDLLVRRIRSMAKEPSARFPVEVTGGAVRYVNEAEGFSVQGDGVRLALAWRDPGHAAVSFGVRDARIRRGAFAIAEVSAAGAVEVENTQSLIQRLEIRHGHSTARVQGQVSHQPFAFKLTGNTEVDLAEIGQLAGSQKPFAGMLLLKGDLSGGEAPAKFAGTAELARPGVVWGIPLQRVKGLITYEADRLEVDTLYAEGFGGKLTGGGVLWPAGRRYTADLRFHSLELAELLKQSGRSAHASSRLSGRLTLEGQGADQRALTAESDFTFEDLRVKEGGRTSRGAFKGKLANGRVEIVRLVLARGKSETTASGRVDLTSRALALEFRARVEDLGRDLWPASPIQDIGGRMTLTGRITQTWDAPLFTGRMRAERLSVHSRMVTLVEGPVVVTRERLTSKRLLLRIGRSQGEVSGQLDFSSVPVFEKTWAASLRPSISLSFRGRAEDLAPLLPLSTPVKGRVVMHLEAAGKIPSLQGRGSLSLTDIELSTDRIQAARASLVLRGDTLVFPEVVVQRRGVTVRAEGEVNWSGAYRFTSAPLALDLASLPGLRQGLATGRGTLRAWGSGQLAKPQIEGELTVTNLGVATVSFGNGAGRFALADNGWQWELAFASGYRARGRFPLMMAGPFHADLEAESADLTPWLRGVDLRQPFRVKGSGRARLEGALDSAEGLQAQIEVTEASGHLGPAGWQTARPVRLALRHGKVEIEEAELTGPLLHLRMKGEVVLHDRIALELSGHAAHPVVAPWIPAVSDFRGSPSIELNLSGPLRALSVSGHAQLETVGVKLDALPFWVDVHRGDVKFTNDAYEFHIRQGKIHGGNLEAEGSAAKRHDRWKHSIRFKLDRAEFGAMLASLDPSARWAEGDLQTWGTLSFETAKDREVDVYNSLEGRASFTATNGTLSRYPGLVRAFALIGAPADPARLPDLTQERLPYRQITGDFVIAKGLMETKHLVLDSPVVRMSGIGSIKLPERHVNFQVAVQLLERLESGIRRIPIVGRILPKDKGLLVMYLNATGSLLDPHLAVAPIKTLSQNIVDLLLFLIRAPDRLLIPSDAR